MCGAEVFGRFMHSKEARLGSLDRHARLYLARPDLAVATQSWSTKTKLIHKLALRCQQSSANNIRFLGIFGIMINQELLRSFMNSRAQEISRR